MCRRDVPRVRGKEAFGELAGGMGVGRSLYANRMVDEDDWEYFSAVIWSFHAFNVETLMCCVSGVGGRNLKDRQGCPTSSKSRHTSHARAARVFPMSI